MAAIGLGGMLLPALIAPRRSLITVGDLLLWACRRRGNRPPAAVRRPGGPTAVFTYNDEYGALLYRALGDLGAVMPDDVALVGAGNLPIATFLRLSPSDLNRDRWVK